MSEYLKQSESKLSVGVLYWPRATTTCLITIMHLADSGEEPRARLQWRIKRERNCELNALLSCGCLISGVSHRRHRNRVNANEMWWKASPSVAQPEHTSSDYCTINHPCVNASAFIIRTPIRRPNLCSPSHKPRIRKRTRGESVVWQQHRRWLAEESRRAAGRKMFCRLCLSGSMSVLRYPWVAQIYSIKPGFQRTLL